MFYFLLADWRRLWLAAGAPGRRKQPVSETSTQTVSHPSTLLPQIPPLLLPSPEQTGSVSPRLPMVPVPSPKPNPKRQRELRGLVLEAGVQRAALDTTIRATRATLYRRSVSQDVFEEFVRGIERITEQAEADPARFLQFEEFLGAEVQQTWRELQAFLPSALAPRLVRAYLRLAQITQQNGAPLESQWTFYLLAYALDPHLEGASRQATQVADQLDLRTPEAQTLRLLARRSV